MSPAPTQSPTLISLTGIASELVALERGLASLAGEMQKSVEAVARQRRESAVNLVHYVALRQHDLRSLQARLSQNGLSSLGRSESAVMSALQMVYERVNEGLALRGDPGARQELSRLADRTDRGVSWEAARSYLHQHTREILGPRPDDRHVYIMVTAPSAAEADRRWMVRLLAAGMNVLRINCAHEGEAEWKRVIDALNDAQRETGKECRVLMDLAGPKIRTGEIAGRHIATWKPTKDELGRVTAPARVVVRRASAQRRDDEGSCLVMPDKAFAKVREGDTLHFRDARGSKRSLVFREVSKDEAIALTSKRVYVQDEVPAELRRRKERVTFVMVTARGAGGAAIDVRTGDALVLTRRLTDGKPPARDRAGKIKSPGVVSCALPAALAHLEEGHRVLFDDGRIHAIVETVKKQRGDFLLRVVRTPKDVVKLRAEKGINLPDTITTVPSLAESDLRALAFAAKHADAVSLSFVRTPDDVRSLHDELDRLGRNSIGIVLKIETRAGFENLPQLLLEGLRRPPVAVMIARGDLAVEIGFERLAEVQEEILWLCEASHVPAIWATQVLDTLARTGIPSRAEVTDAAASVAAECVMLNKGPYVHEAVSLLANILRKMEKHHFKKRSLFRKLRVSKFGVQ